MRPGRLLVRRSLSLAASTCAFQCHVGKTRNPPPSSAAQARQPGAAQCRPSTSPRQGCARCLPKGGRSSHPAAGASAARSSLGVDALPHRQYKGLLWPTANPDFQFGRDIDGAARVGRQARNRQDAYGIPCSCQCGRQIPGVTLRTPGINGKEEREGAHAGDAHQCNKAQSAEPSIFALVAAPSCDGAYATGYARQLPRLNRSRCERPRNAAAVVCVARVHSHWIYGTKPQPSPFCVRNGTEEEGND